MPFSIRLRGGANVVAALSVVGEHVGDGLGAGAVVFLRGGGGDGHDRAERQENSNCGISLFGVGLRGVDRPLYGVEIVLAGGDVDLLGADADGDIDLFAEHACELPVRSSGTGTLSVWKLMPSCVAAFHWTPANSGSFSAMAANFLRPLSNLAGSFTSTPATAVNESGCMSMAAPPSISPASIVASSGVDHVAHGRL